MSNIRKEDVRGIYWLDGDYEKDLYCRHCMGDDDPEIGTLDDIPEDLWITSEIIEVEGDMVCRRCGVKL
jgi:hypothetical protein